jgi:alkanesulfonate monooxygenase SsuD/methylene tetrahydromethanopterin reductase-like flavin-dependent oxidoreductase (luciferase family)
MKLGFFTMPIHPVGRNLTETLREDREFCLIAEKLGFCEGFFGEHITDGAETIASSLIFIAWLLNETKTITLGSGTINLPNQHPARVAAEVAMIDHMAEGRYVMGISPGGLLSDAEVFGNLDKDRTEMFVEAIDHILGIWSSEAPYKRVGKHWSITTERMHIPSLGQGTIHKPFQRPHPPIAVTAVAPFSKGVTEAATRGWEPISANFLLPVWVRTHWPKYVEGCQRASRPADPANWRVAKSIFVADDLATARRYATEPGSPYYAYYKSLATKLVGNGRGNLFKHDQSAPDSSVTVESIIDNLVIWGTPDKVADELAAFRDEIGPFGTLLYAGHDWADRTLAIRSLELMAEKVMPALNAGTQSAAAE